MTHCYYPTVLIPPPRLLQAALLRLICTRFRLNSVRLEQESPSQQRRAHTTPPPPPKHANHQLERESVEAQM